MAAPKAVGKAVERLDGDVVVSIRGGGGAGEIGVLNDISLAET